MKKRIKKAVVLLVGVTVFLLSTVVFAAAEPDSEEPVRLYVTVADQNGSLVLAREEIPVRDADGDGALTVNDALLCAHEQKFEGGEAGYASETTAYGLSLTKLWGVENGGVYGYYVNHVSAMSLLDPVSAEDLVCAFIYTDTETWSDTYCHFDLDHTAVVGDETLTLTLAAGGYDENWNPITVPVAGATILINGKETAFVTDAEGKVVLQFDGAGYCIVSAKKDGAILVPPVCGVAVRSDRPVAGDSSQLVLWFALLSASLVALLFLCRRSRAVD